MMKWMPIELEKPRFSDDILFTDGKKVYKGWLETYEPGEDLSFYNDTSQLREDRWPENVSHWMYLPKLPE